MTHLYIIHALRMIVPFDVGNVAARVDGKAQYISSLNALHVVPNRLERIKRRRA